MTATTYPNGIGGSLGDSLAIGGPLYMSGQVWYIDYTNGLDANAGTNREQPKKTFASALAASADNDIIVLLPGHSELCVSTINKRLTIVGEGFSGGIPGASLVIDTSLIPITASAANVRFRGIYFYATGDAAGVGIAVTGASFHMRDCYYRIAGNNSVGMSFSAAATGSLLERNTFIAYPTSTTDSAFTNPSGAIRSDGALSDFTMRENVFSSGTGYFSSGYAVDLSTGAHTRLALEENSLLLGADVRINSAATGHMKMGTVTGGSRVNW